MWQRRTILSLLARQNAGFFLVPHVSSSTVPVPRQEELQAAASGLSSSERSAVPGSVHVSGSAEFFDLLICKRSVHCGCDSTIGQLRGSDVMTRLEGHHQIARVECVVEVCVAVSCPLETKDPMVMIAAVHASIIVYVVAKIVRAKSNLPRKQIDVAWPSWPSPSKSPVAAIPFPERSNVKTNAALASDERFT